VLSLAVLSLLNSETSTPIALDAIVTFSSFLYGVACGITLGALAVVLPSVSVVRKDIPAALHGLT